jgi:hypothetical protein
MTIYELIALASKDIIDDEQVFSFCELHSISVLQFVDMFSIEIAKGYNNGEHDFDFADSAMNTLWGFMTDPPFLDKSGNTIPEPAMDIYEAFDAGEYYHSGDCRPIDPEVKYTKPYIKDILNRDNEL